MGLGDRGHGGHHHGSDHDRRDSAYGSGGRDYDRDNTGRNQGIHPGL